MTMRTLTLESEPCQEETPLDSESRDTAAPIRDVSAFLSLLYGLTGATNDAQLADRIGVSTGKIADWRAGRYKVTLHILNRIKERVGVPISTLLDETAIKTLGMISIFGFGAAGEGIEVDDSGYPVDESDDKITRSLMNRDEHSYATRVRGTSMVPYFMDGDIVEVVTNIEAHSGDPAVVIHKDGRKWIKIVHFKAKRRTVVGESVNKAEEDAIWSLDELRAIHKIISIRRKGMY